MIYVKYIILGFIMGSSLNLYAANNDIIANKEVIKVEVSNEHLKTLNEASTLLLTHQLNT